jgi:hypothetical protein
MDLSQWRSANGMHRPVIDVGTGIGRVIRDEFVFGIFPGKRSLASR